MSSVSDRFATYEVGSLVRQLNDLLCENDVGLDVIVSKAKEIETSVGWKGESWGWLNIPWTADSDNGKVLSQYVRENLVHPGIHASRRGSATAMRRLFDFGMNGRVKFVNGCSCDLAVLAPRSKKAGMVELFSSVMSEGKLVSLWSLGCASSVWASGMSELAVCFPNFGKSSKTVDLVEGETFDSQMEALLWNTSCDDVCSLKDTLRSFLDFAPVCKWRVGEIFGSEGLKYENLIDVALHAGAWWAIEDLMAAYSSDTSMKEFAKGIRLERFMDEGFSDDEKQDRVKAFSLFQSVFLKGVNKQRPSRKHGVSI